jgi:hypothetical protein
MPAHCTQDERVVASHIVRTCYNPLHNQRLPCGNHSSPFEEIDEVADTLFNREACGNSLPAGRAAKRPTIRKGKGVRGSPRARIRDAITSTRRDKWLASLIPPATAQEHHTLPSEYPLLTRGTEDVDTATEPKDLSDLWEFQEDG